MPESEMIFFQHHRMFCVITQIKVSQGQEQRVSFLQSGNCQFRMSKQIQFLLTFRANKFGKKALQIVEININLSDSSNNLLF